MAQLRPDLRLELGVRAHVALEDGSHPSPKGDVFGEDFIDVRRVEEHFDDLIEEVVERVVSDLDAVVLGDLLSDAAELAGAAARPLQELTRLVIDDALRIEIALEDRLHVRHDLALRVRLDVLRRDEGPDHFLREGSDLGAVESHSGGPYPTIAEMRRDVAASTTVFCMGRRAHDSDESQPASAKPMSVCPFCNKAAVIDPQTPCRSCGRRATDHPAAAPQAQVGIGRTVETGGGWDDDDDGLGGGLELSRGGSFATHSSGPSAYSGGGLSLGDDDPFADDGLQGGALELDLPSSHTANAPRSIGPAAENAGSAAEAAAGAVPDLVLPNKPQPSRAPQSEPSLQSPRGPQSEPSLQPPRVPQSEPSLQPPRVPQSERSLQPPRSPASGGQLPGEPSSGASGPAPTSQPALALGAAPSSRGGADPALAMIARYPVAPEKIWEAPAYALKVLWRQFELRQDLASLRKKRSPDVPLYERALRTHDAKTFALGLAITCAGLAVASFIFFLPVILRFLRAPD